MKAFLALLRCWPGFLAWRCYCFRQNSTPRRAYCPHASHCCASARGDAIWPRCYQLVRSQRPRPRSHLACCGEMLRCRSCHCW